MDLKCPLYSSKAFIKGEMGRYITATQQRDNLITGAKDPEIHNQPEEQVKDNMPMKE